MINVGGGYCGLKVSYASVSLSRDVITGGLPSVYFSVELSINKYVNSLTFKEPKITFFAYLFSPLEVWVLFWIIFIFINVGYYIKPQTHKNVPSKVCAWGHVAICAALKKNELPIDMKNLVRFPVLTSEDMQLIYVLKCHPRIYSFCKNSLQYIFVRYTELQISFQESEMTHKQREKTLHSI